MDLAVKDVQRHLGKFIATTAGVGLLLAIVLTMNGIYRGNIADGVWLIENTRTDLWVVERGRGGPFNEQSRLREEAVDSVAAVPGVEKASPFITYSVQRVVGGNSQQFTVIGYDVFGGLGGPGRIVAGRSIRRAHYEIVVDSKLGLKLNDRVNLGLHDFTVVGLTRDGVDSGGNPLAYLSLPDAQEILYQQDNEALRAQREAGRRVLDRAGLGAAQSEAVLPLLSPSTRTISAVLVKLAPGANPSAVARHIERWLYFNAYTSPEELDLVLRGRLLKMTQVLGLFRSLLVVVSIVIIALLIYVLTMEKIRSIATLKLIGAGNWVIVRLILEQSLVLTMASFGIGLALINVIHDKFPRTLVLLPSDTALTFAVMFAGGILASLVGIWQALRTPPSMALGG